MTYFSLLQKTCLRLSNGSPLFFYDLPRALLLACVVFACSIMSCYGQTAGDTTYDFKHGVLYHNGKRLPTKRFNGTIEIVDLSAQIITIRDRNGEAQVIGTGNLQSAYYFDSRATSLGGSSGGGPSIWPSSIPAFQGLPFADLIQGCLADVIIFQDKPSGSTTWEAYFVAIHLTPEREAYLQQKRAEAQQQKVAREKEIAEKARSEWLEKVAAWRALKVKPPLPDEAHKYKVLAENAFKEERFEEAAKYYESGLHIEPLWPEGQFNAALIYGELKNYSQAADHMHAYLDLAPDAPDAGQAKDKIIIWEEKAKNGSK